MKRSTKQSIWTFLELTVHGMLLLAPIALTCVLHESDSLLHQLPLSTTADDTFPSVGFGLRYFSIEINNNNESSIDHGFGDISFSDEQEDAVGSYHIASHYLYHAVTALMWLALLVPLLVAVRHGWYDQIHPTLVFVKLCQTLVRRTVPALMALTLLLLVPFGLLFQSNLCGPTYIELGFDYNATLEESTSSDDRGDDYDGTFAVNHSDVPSECDWGTSGISFAMTIFLLQAVMALHGMCLDRRCEKLKADYSQEMIDGTLKGYVDDEATLSSDCDGTQMILPVV